MTPEHKIAGRDELWWIRGYAAQMQEVHSEVLGTGRCGQCQQEYPCMTRRLSDAVVELADHVMEEGADA